MNRIDANEFNDECPNHGGEIKKEYDFGSDATVYTFTRCRCCLVQTRDLAGYPHDTASVGTWEDCQGIARLQLAMNSAR